MRNRRGPLRRHYLRAPVGAGFSPSQSCVHHLFPSAYDLLLLKGQRRDDDGRAIAREGSLICRIPRKHLAVFHEEARLLTAMPKSDPGTKKVMERVHRMRLVVDYISGMTDGFALQTFQLISGAQVNPHGS
jgi:dGTP triphosphohydrolase